MWCVGPPTFWGVIFIVGINILLEYNDSQFLIYKYLIKHKSIQTRIHVKGYFAIWREINHAGTMASNSHDRLCVWSMQC